MRPSIILCTIPEFSWRGRQTAARTTPDLPGPPRTYRTRITDVTHPTATVGINCSLVFSLSLFDVVFSAVGV
jgi:hypothetical protein